MRRCVAKTVTRVGNPPPNHCCHGISNLLAWSALYEPFAFLAGANPADVILVNHILSIKQCAARDCRGVLTNPSIWW